MRTTKILIVMILLVNGISNAQTYSKALETKAQNGDIKAMYDMSMCLKNGKGIAKNPTKSLFWLKKAADNGNVVAQREFGDRYAEGDGVDKDLEKAFEWFMKAANQGDATAQTEIGCFYNEGAVVSKSITEAGHWFRKAAEQGYGPAQHNVGIFYKYGYGDYPQNDNEAIAWLEKAVVNNYKLARGPLYELYSKVGDVEKLKKIVSSIQISANKGNKNAKWNLPIVQMWLAVASAMAGNMDEAFRLTKLAVENKTNSPVGAMRAIQKIYTLDEFRDNAKAEFWKKRANEEKAKNGEASMELK